MGETEVTQELWRAVMGKDPEELRFKGQDKNPVENVSWDDCQEFIKKLNQQTGKTYKLPTEAQWEYAAGGGSSNRTKWAGTNSESDLGEFAWYGSNSDSKPHPVKLKKPNSLGLYDMSGNVWEWCSDWYAPYPTSAQTDPQGASSGSGRVGRGGGWHYDTSYCRVAYRGSFSPAYRINDLGFRVVRVL
jgi:formylglycine-generating enzyme required for sulfatase activity